MEGKVFSVPFLLLVLLLEYKVTSANICASSPTVLTTSSGKFSTPNYQNNYPHNTTKTWKIEAQVGQVIDLYFTTFSLERSSSCQHDYVKIRSSCGETVPMAVYCDHTARPLRSTSNVLWVEFRSDASLNYKGFEAIYKINSAASKLLSCPRPSDNSANIDYCLVGGQVQCCYKDDSNCRVNKILTDKSGTITSPGYPSYYPHGIFYLWRITVPEGYVVQINFTTLITYQSLSCSNAFSNCTCDFIQVLDGPCKYSFGPRWCGAWTSQNKYPSFITTGRHMLVAFRSDLTNNHIGFVANYRRALNCSGDKPISCVTNGNPSCCLRDATVCVSGTSTRSHCPRDGDPASYTGCCTVYVFGSPSCCPVLQSGYSISCPRSSDNQAFLDVCSSRDQPTCCNRNLPTCRYNKLLTEPSGIITSPGHPNNYPHNSVVVWRITVPEGYLVQLNFTKLNIERGAACLSCNCDYVGVRNGPCSNIIGTKWCGTEMSSKNLPSFISTGRHLQVFFRSDSSYNRDGFVARYRRALKCSGATPYSCLNNGQPACCKTQGASLVSSSTKLWITMVIMTTALQLM